MAGLAVRMQQAVPKTAGVNSRCLTPDDISDKLIPQQRAPRPMFARTICPGCLSTSLQKFTCREVGAVGILSFSPGCYDAARRIRSPGAPTGSRLFLRPLPAGTRCGRVAAGHRRAAHDAREVDAGARLRGLLSRESAPRIRLSQTGAGNIRWADLERTDAAQVAIGGGKIHDREILPFHTNQDMRGPRECRLYGFAPRPSAEHRNGLPVASVPLL